MCYFCHCFGWTLDLLQRIVTFVLACCLGFVVCTGLIVAIVTGVAYGYNYCMAEFITFTRSDVTVYMRRDNFPKPEPVDFLVNLRSGIKTNENVNLNVKEANKYAVRLTKYSPIQQKYTAEIQTAKELDLSDQYYKPPTNGYSLLTSPSPRVISVIPYKLQATTHMQSGSSEILMEEFRPTDIEPLQIDRTQTSIESIDYVEAKERNIMLPNAHGRIPAEGAVGTTTDENVISERKTLLLIPEHETRTAVIAQRSQIPMRHWGTTQAAFVDYSVEKRDDDSIIYKTI